MNVEYVVVLRTCPNAGKAIAIISVTATSVREHAATAECMVVNMMLFHSFPRPRRVGLNTRADEDRRDATSLLVLESILRYGILCTPERLNIFPAHLTMNRRKRKLLESGSPEYSHSQSRFCLTLCDAPELFERKIRGIVPASDGPRSEERHPVSHADLFGFFAVAFDPLSARRLGIVPTVYFSPSDIFGHRFLPGGGEAPGLNIQIVQRLKELRELLIVHAMIERSVTTADGSQLPGDDVLHALDLRLPFEDEIVRRVYALSDDDRRRVFDLFDIDRELALGLVSFTEMMLSLFQETDSSADAGVLAFYQQREWRLIHHMREGMLWYCLGEQPVFRNPFATMRRKEIERLKSIVNEVAASERSESYFKHCWLLEQVDGVHVNQFIANVVVPARMLQRVREAVRRAECPAEVTPAEDLRPARE
jgi:hypothetical protein